MDPNIDYLLITSDILYTKTMWEVNSTVREHYSDLDVAILDAIDKQIEIEKKAEEFSSKLDHLSESLFLKYKNKS